MVSTLPLPRDKKIEQDIDNYFFILRITINFLFAFLFYLLTLYISQIKDNINKERCIM